MLNQTVNFIVRENSYPVNFPDIDQLLKIELIKMELSKGNYGSMIRTNTIAAFAALDFIDMVANLTVLCPKLIDDLKAPDRNLLKLNIIDAKELMKAYRTQLSKWVADWNRMLRDFDDEPKEEDKKG